VHPRIEWTGSQWCVLSRKFCEWILDSDKTRQICRYLSTTILSDELIMQNLLANSPFFAERSDFLHYLQWPGPKILQGQDVEKVISSNKFSARKFDITIDAAILERVADHNDFEVPQ
jgi:hypothetical protein